MKRNRLAPSQLPLRVRENPKHHAEVIVFDALHQQLNQKQRDWVVVYSARWMTKLGRGTPKTGEADFLLAHPHHGVVVVEVKGGEIVYENNGWFSISKSGNKYEIDPFVQVERNAYELTEKFQQMRRWQGGANNDKYARWVIFPEAVTPRDAVFPTDYDAAMVTDFDGMNSLVEGLLSASRFWYGDRWDHPAAPHACDLLLELFDRPLTFSMPLAQAAKNEAQQIETLTDSQFSVISAIAGCPRAAIAGGAGSGKTWLARKRAVQLAEEGFRVLLTCQSRPLAKYVRETTAKHDELIIEAYEDLLSVLDPDVKDISDGEYPWKLAETIESNPALSFDAVFVDEGQDFTADQWSFVEALLGKEKLGVFYVFYDDNQQLGSGATTLPSDLIPIHLSDNVRTTRAIHRDMEKYYQGNKKQDARGPNGRSVSRVTSDGNLKQKLRTEIDSLLSGERFSAADIAVLTPVDTEQSALLDLSLSHGRSLRTQPVANKSGLVTDVLFASIKDFKGLERPVVIVCEFDRLPSNIEEQRRLLYTALSRPKSHLILIDPPTLDIE